MGLLRSTFLAQETHQIEFLFCILKSFMLEFNLDFLNIFFLNRVAATCFDHHRQLLSIFRLIFFGFILVSRAFDSHHLKIMKG
jgi:hypothetical protein